MGAKALSDVWSPSPTTNTAIDYSPSSHSRIRQVADAHQAPGKPLFQGFSCAWPPNGELTGIEIMRHEYPRAAKVSESITFIPGSDSGTKIASVLALLQTRLGAVTDEALNDDLYGWWRITETSQWANDSLDDLGPALISITGDGDRLRMQHLLAYVNIKPTKAGASFTWEGSWEYDQMSGTGSVRLAKDGRLLGKFRIKYGDDSNFIAERTSEPEERIAPPPSYRDKWR